MSDSNHLKLVFSDWGALHALQYDIKRLFITCSAVLLQANPSTISAKPFTFAGALLHWVI